MGIDSVPRPAVLAAALLVAGPLLSGCETALRVIAHGGADDLVWPLPPDAARLRYDGAFDIAHGMPRPARVITGLETPSLRHVPLRIAARGGLMAVVERERGVVSVYDRARAQTFMLVTDAGGRLEGARDVAVDDSSRIYVIEGAAGRVGVYDNTGRPLYRFGSDREWRQPERIALDPLRDRLYVADGFLNQVFVFSLRGAYLFTIGRHGWNQGRFNGLVDVAVDAAGNVVTVEAANRRLQRFTPAGLWQHALSRADGPYALVEPVAVAFEEDGTMYVADRYREAVLVFDADWQPIMTLGGLGRGPARFDGLADVEFDPRERRLYTCETAFPRIQMFRRSEAPWRPFP